MSDADPLLALIPTRTVDANNRLRAQMIVDRIVSDVVMMNREQARADLFDVILAHLTWSNCEAVAKDRAGTPDTLESVSEKVSLARAVGHRLAAMIEKGEIDP